MSDMSEHMEPDTAFYRSQRFTALVLAIIPGFGQFYNRQFVKGALFFVLLVSFYGVSRDFIAHGMWGIRTLGENLPQDNSVFLLAEGVIA
ncbi:sugar ABC transporter permease, partial [Vibrio diabolicus]|nr:sugar ABC transporter permease [Vibrio diabolicus]